MAEEKNNAENKNQNTDENVNELRAKLKHTLKRFIPNKDILEKEISIFEKTVSRRNFLTGTAKISAVATLVGQGLVPSAWAAKRPDIALPGDELPVLTNEMKAMVTTAAKIKVSSDVVNGVLKHRHIEHVSEKYLEDTLESLNPLVRAQEDFQSPEQGLSHLEGAMQRTYGHPEMVRLQNCSQNSINGKELDLYEYRTNHTAPLKPRTIQLPTNYPEELIIETKEGKNWELQKGSQVESKYFKLIFQNDNNVVIYAKDTEGQSTATWGADTIELLNAEVLVLQTDGRLAIYNKEGKFLKDLAEQGDMPSGPVNANPRMRLTRDGLLILESKKNNQWQEYHRLGSSHNVDTSKFDTVNDKDFEFNRVVSVNGPKHNTVEYNKVKNQKMILVAKQSVKGSWDGSPGKWIEHVNEMESCYHQTALYVQNTEHDVHSPDDKTMLKAGAYDQGKISDTSGQTWKMFNPLALLEQKLNDFDFDVRVPRHQEEDKNNARARITIEDIGKFTSSNDFSCLYGTVKVNLWCNLGFYIYFHESQDDPVVKFFAIDQDIKRSIAYDSDTTYHDGGKARNSHNIWSKIHYKKDYRLDDSVLVSGQLEDFQTGIMYHENARRLSHILLRKNGKKSFIEQLFKPVGFIDDGRRDGNKKILFSYEHVEIHDMGNRTSDIRRSAAFEFLPYDDNEGVYQVQHHNYSYDIQAGGGVFVTYNHKEISDLRKIYKSSEEYFNSVADNLHEVIFGNINGKYKGIFQYYKRYGSDNLYTLYHSRAYKWGTSHEKFMQAIVYFNQGSALIEDEKSQVIDFKTFKSPFETDDKHYLALHKIFEHKEDVAKASLDFSFTGAARLSFLMTDGRMYIVNQAIDREQGNYAPPVFENQFAKWNNVYIQTSSQAQNNSNYVKTLRLLDWKKFSNDLEQVCVQEIKDDVSTSIQYSYITKEIVDQTWHCDKIDAQLAMGEDVITDHIEEATIYDVELQVVNCYDKSVVLEENQCFEIRFAQPVYTENFTQGDQRGVGTYAKRMESIFVKPDTSGRALIQVRVPRLDQLSGITFTYRILDNHKFESAINSPLLRLKSNVDDIHAWHQINLAYNIHSRMSDQSIDDGSDLMAGIFDKLDSDYTDNDDIKGKLRKGLINSSSSLRQGSFGEDEVEKSSIFQRASQEGKPTKKRNKQIVSDQPNILYRNQNDNVLYQSQSNVAVINPMFNSNSQIASGLLGGWLSDIWHSICDFAISILNKIKEAIEWVKNKLDDILDALVDLGIPGISDIAKIAKIVVSLVAGVLTAIVDVAIMIVNILKYAFDFKEAQDIGKELTGLAIDVFGLVKFEKKQSFQRGFTESIDFDSKVKAIDANALDGIDKVYSDTNSKYKQDDTDAPDNINFVKNTMDKHLGDDESNKALNQELQSFSFKYLPVTSSETLYSTSNSGSINTIIDIFTNLSITNPESLNIKSIFNKISDLKFNSLADEMQESFNQALDSVPLNPVDMLNDFLTMLDKIKVNAVIKFLIKTIFGVDFNSFLDIFYLILGYPTMMVSVIASEMIKTFVGTDLGISDINATITDARNHIKNPPQKAYSGLTYTDGKWHKDPLVTISLALDVIGMITSPISTGLDTLSESEKSEYTALFTALDIISIIPTMISSFNSSIKNSLKVTSILPIGLNPSKIEELGWLYNSFGDKSKVDSPFGDKLAYLKILQHVMFNGFLIKVLSFKSSTDKQKENIKHYKALASVVKILIGIFSLIENINIAIIVKDSHTQSKQLWLSIVKDIVVDIDTLVASINALIKYQTNKANIYFTITDVVLNMAIGGIAIGQLVSDENS